MLNEFPKMNMEDNETGCCPRFHPEDWDNKYIELKDELFAKTSTRSFFYTPLNLGSVYTKAQQNIDASDAAEKERYVILAEDVSPWKANHYFKVTKDVQNMDMVKLNGKYFMKVFDGGYNEVPKFIKELKEVSTNQNETVDEFFIFYTTCPKCAKHYGHNYMVFLNKV